MTKRTLRAALLTSLAVVALAVGASAQEFEAKTSIPFEFTANGTTMPAGNYVLRTLGTGNVLVIEALNAPTHAVAMVVGGRSDYNHNSVTLLFTKTGDQRTLTKIATPAGTVALK